MKTRIIVALLLIVMLIAPGCKKSSNDNSVGKTNGDSAGKSTAQLQEGYSEISDQSDSSNTTAEPTLRKIIKNGTLDLESEDVAKAYSDILKFVKENGGYEFKHTQTDRNNYVSVTAQIKIDPEKLDLLMNFAGESANIINSTTTSNDITDKYYDAETRLKTKKEVLKNYYKFLDEAKTLSETLQIQNEINKLTEEIEATEGKLRMWNELISESTVDITISQINDPLKPKKDVDLSTMSWGDMGTAMKNGFMSVANVIIGIFQWILIIIVAVSPLLIIAAIVLFILRKRSKGSRAKKQVQNAHVQNSQVQNNIPPSSDSNNPQ